MAKPRLWRRGARGRFTSKADVQADPAGTSTERERVYVEGDTVLVRTPTGPRRQVVVLSPDGEAGLIPAVFDPMPKS